MKEQTKNICGKCAALLKAGGGIKLTVSRGKDQKVLCENCGRRRFGGEYRIQIKG